MLSKHLPHSSPEVPAIEQPGSGEPKGKRPPHTDQPGMKDNGKDVTQWQTDDEEGEEGREYQRLHVGDASQTVAENDLHAVAELINHKRDDCQRH